MYDAVRHGALVAQHVKYPRRSDDVVGFVAVVVSCVNAILIVRKG